MAYILVCVMVTNSGHAQEYSKLPPLDLSQLDNVHVSPLIQNRSQTGTLFTTGKTKKAHVKPMLSKNSAFPVL